MQAQEIEMYLAELGQELQNLGVQRPIRILLVGGAFMLTQVRNRFTTDDVDVLLKDIEDSTTSVLYQIFKAAVRAVTSRNKIPPIFSVIRCDTIEKSEIAITTRRQYENH